MEDILRLLLEDELKNLNGFEFMGQINVPKDLLAESIKDSLISQKQEEEVIEDASNQPLFHPEDYKNFIENVDIIEMNVYFEEDDVCLKFDFRK
ncbi:MAG: hypothetical protein R2753_03740 [Chitinophagales bacterium]